MKAILLAGGTGSRLFPITRAVNKHLLPVYDRPMIFYPLESLKMAGATEILLITSSPALPSFKQLLGTGAEWGLEISYAIQEQPGGIPEAFLIAEAFLAGDPCLLALGDNILINAVLEPFPLDRTTLCAVTVPDPSRFGVVELNATGIVSIEEKPANPKSSLAIIGFYAFPGDAPAIAKTLKPSQRGELEITDLIKRYQTRNLLDCRVLSCPYFDCGTFNSLLDASLFVKEKARLRA